MRKYFFICLLFTVCVNTIVAQSKYKNIRIDRQEEGILSYPPCEPSIAINPKNPANVVAGAILDRVYVSQDTGRTWVESTLKSGLGVFGDPCIVASKKGHFYYLHLSDPKGSGWGSERLLDRIVCQMSKDGGNTWSSGGGMGENHPKDQDKEWAACSPNGNRVCATWTQFDAYESKKSGDESNILFSHSNCKAKKWKKAVQINEVPGDCLDGDNTVEGAVPAYGPKGELYVSWALGDTIFFDRSTDGGKTWLTKDIRAAQISGGWAQDIPGILRCNGMPVLMCDLSEGVGKGNLYITWSDTRNGADDTDIFFTSSSDGGNTWTPAKRINQDSAGKQQFFPWLAIDQSNGHLHIVYYDRRNYSDNKTDVFLATSMDGGKTWTEEVISESPFDPDPTVFFGDYNNISAHNGIVRPIWTRCEKSKLSVWTALIQK
jgi:hypothetical protein